MLDNVWKVSNYIYDRRITIKEAAGICSANSLLGNTKVTTCAVNVLTVAIVSFISGLFLTSFGIAAFIIPGAIIIWSNTGLWRSSTIYQNEKLVFQKGAWKLVVGPSNTSVWSVCRPALSIPWDWLPAL